jgi:hypothetical protein
MMSPGHTNNVNVNVNVSINESPLVNSQSLNALGYLHTEYLKRLPLLKPAKVFPSSYNTTPHSAKQLPSFTTHTEKVNNPERNTYAKR